MNIKKFIKLTPKEFPPLLREINDPPKELYLEGKLPTEDYIYLTVVGSRRHSRYGQEAVKRLISELTGYPIAIISGLAIGLDAMAHEAAIEAGLAIVAVPGSGLDRSVLHPPSNRRLADKIISAGGAIISELSPMTPAGIHTFPRRNRIMAGLSKGTLVIEAAKKSGTLITARLALEYNREVFAVPGSIFSPTSFGPNQLVKEGATPITTGEELLLALDFEPTSDLIDREPVNLTLQEQMVIELLTVEPLPRDEIIKRLKLPANEVNSLLSLMEIRGFVKESMGEVWLTK